MSDWLVGGIAINGFPGMLSDWGRFTIWNKKRNDWGMWDIGPNDKLGDILETGDNYSVIVRTLCETPTADHIAAAKACGVMDSLNGVHGVFNKGMADSPLIQKHVNPQHTICFSYYPPSGHGYGAYGNWHAFMRVKPAGESMAIGKRGTGVNYIIPITQAHCNIENKGHKLLEKGVPYTLTSNNIELKPSDYSLILHIHEINTQ